MADVSPEDVRAQLLEDTELMTGRRRKQTTSRLCDICSDEWPCGTVESVADGLAKRDVEVAERAVLVAAQMFPAMARDLVSRGSVRTWLNGNAAQIAASSLTTYPSARSSGRTNS